MSTIENICANEAPDITKLSSFSKQIKQHDGPSNIIHNLKYEQHHGKFLKSPIDCFEVKNFQQKVSKVSEWIKNLIIQKI